MSKNRFYLLDDENIELDTSTVAPAPTLKFGKKTRPTPQWVKPTVAPETPPLVPSICNNTKPKGKKSKSNSRKNKENLLKMLQSQSDEVVITPIINEAPTPSPEPKPSPPPPPLGHTSWVTISVPDKTRPANCVMDNYKLMSRPMSPEQIGSSILQTLSNKYNTYRENYINNYGADEYDKRYMCPHYDYHWASRSSEYIPDIYDTYPPEYLPYMLMKNGTVRDFTYSPDTTEELYSVCCENLAEYESEEEPIEKFSKYTKFLSS